MIRSILKKLNSSLKPESYEMSNKGQPVKHITKKTSNQRSKIFNKIDQIYLDIKALKVRTKYLKNPLEHKSEFDEKKPAAEIQNRSKQRGKDLFKNLTKNNDPSALFKDEPIVNKAKPKAKKNRSSSSSRSSNIDLNGLELRTKYIKNYEKMRSDKLERKRLDTSSPLTLLNKLTQNEESSLFKDEPADKVTPKPQRNVSDNIGSPLFGIEFDVLLPQETKEIFEDNKQSKQVPLKDTPLSFIGKLWENISNSIW